MVETLCDTHLKKSWFPCDLLRLLDRKRVGGSKQQLRRKFPNSYDIDPWICTQNNWIKCQQKTNSKLKTKGWYPRQLENGLHAAAGNKHRLQRALAAPPLNSAARPGARGPPRSSCSAHSFSISASLSLFSALTLYSHAHIWSIKLSLYVYRQFCTGFWKSQTWCLLKFVTWSYDEH